VCIYQFNYITTRWLHSKFTLSFNTVTTGWMTRGLIPCKVIFLLSETSRLALGPTQSPIQWAPGMKSSLFSDVTYRLLVVIYRRFGTTYRSHLQELSRNVDGYQSTLCNVLEERRSHLHLEGRLKSRYWGSFLGVKRPGRKVNHSPPSSSGLKHEWNHTCTPLTRCYDVVKDKVTCFLP
jgi:hypothetical protein